ncbi:hypothetical protein JHL21_03400 [Devosia sp. WQ 349]|uniref:phage tail assembly protein n=1 Tax=Devosia sp. WQ 349K1 TaxID=2800329 RepID=UPI0019054B75|nr:phage tail assembly protein [Devosia sp. WQ 349K1]MBK1793537.1 hypothetical protein [Devosia sp. WQ 349K1]
MLDQMARHVPLPEPIEFDFTQPVKFEGNTYTRLTFRRRVGPVDVFIAEPIGDTVEKMNAVTASLASVPAAVVGLLSSEDQLRLIAEVQRILAMPPIDFRG